MALPQSCFEASVTALPWINVMCGISQEAAAPLQWQRQEASKQPKALYPYVSGQRKNVISSLFTKKSNIFTLYFSRLKNIKLNDIFYWISFSLRNKYSLVWYLLVVCQKI